MAFAFWKKMFGGEEGEGAETALPEDGGTAAEKPIQGSDAPVSPAGADSAADAQEPLSEPSVESYEPDGSSEPEIPADPARLEEFVLYVARNLVDNPDAVSVSTVEKEHIRVIQIRCEKKDIGKIIGKSGKTIAAVRLLVSGAGGRMGLRMTVDVLD